MRRPPLVSLALVGAGLAVLPPAAPGAARFRPCTSAHRGALCARVTVPLDRSGAIPGAVRLAIERVPGRPRRPGVLIAIVGGPGQSATAVRDAIRDAVRPALRRHELVVFDQRGTGQSGVLRCPRLERAPPPDEVAAAAECARSLGPRRSLYTTRDSVADLEAVRDALGAERVSLLAISYGTKVALAYAVAHPDRVERLVLDSVVAIDGPDPFSRSTYGTLPRVLREQCARRQCARITPDPVADLARLAARLRAAPLRGTVIGSQGERRRATLRTAGLLQAVLSSDVDPTIIPGLPAAARAAITGDSAPVLRLLRRAEAATVPEEPSEFSAALFAAALCEETTFPWPREAAAPERRAQLESALATLGDGPFFPFDRTAAFAASLMPLCLDWPVVPAAPVLPAEPPPAAPTLMLEGQTDLRTPLEDAEALAARLPDARVLRAPGVGHSVISSTFSSCPERALGAFFAGRGVRRACPPDPILSAPPDPLPPRRLSRVAPLRGVAGRRGRTAAAALLTVEDLGPALLGALAESGEDILSGPLAAGGLRGGFYRFTQSGLRLHHVVYVPGVVVSGLVRATGRPGSVRARLSVRGSAAAPGSVNISPSGAVSGTLAGRRYRARPAVAAAASMADPRAALDRARRVAQLLRETTIPAPGVRAGSGGSRAAAAQRRR